MLIIRPGAIGDTLLTFPIIQALRTEYNNPHITLVGNTAVLPLALVFGLVEEVSDYGQLQWSELFSAEGIHALRDVLQHTDFAICWLRDPDGLVEQNLLRAGVKRVMVAPGRPPQGKRIHVVDYLAETLGIAWVRGGPIDCPSPLLGREEIETRFTLRGPPSTPYVAEGPYDKYIAIHPGSGGARKCWPGSSFAAVIEGLWQCGYAVLLLAGPADAERFADLQQILPTPPRPGMLKLLLNAPLLEVAGHLLQCRCYLGNDAGITHLAAMLGIPTVVLFGPTDPAIWRPVGPSVEVIQACELEHLPIEMVEMVMESVLERLL